MRGAATELFRLDGKVCVVTGANGLLGRGFVDVLRSAGATVIGLDIDTVDITSKQALVEFRSEIATTHGALDVLVNNAAMNDAVENAAGDPSISRFENYPLDLWRRVVEVNVTGTFLCCQVLGQMMVEQGSGSIINIASTYGVVAPDQSIYRSSDGSQTFFKSAAYPTTKGAVIMLTKFLASYWGASGVRVNALSPGGVLNGQPEEFVEAYARRTPMGRMATPTDYHGGLLFLASEASTYMTGHNLLIDGGWTAW